MPWTLYASSCYALPISALLPFLTVPCVVHTNVLDVLALYSSIPKEPFSPTPPSSLSPLSWLLPEWRLPGSKKTHFLPSGRFPASYFTLQCPIWMKSKPVVVPAFQHSINTPLPLGEQPEWKAWAHQAQCNTHSVFWCLTKYAGSSSLLPCGTLTNSQKTSNWLCCRSSAFDHKPECGSWHFMY